MSDLALDSVARAAQPNGFWSSLSAQLMSSPEEMTHFTRETNKGSKGSVPDWLPAHDLSDRPQGTPSGEKRANDRSDPLQATPNGEEPLSDLKDPVRGTPSVEKPLSDLKDPMRATRSMEEPLSDLGDPPTS